MSSIIVTKWTCKVSRHTDQYTSAPSVKMLIRKGTFEISISTCLKPIKKYLLMAVRTRSEWSVAYLQETQSPAPAYRGLIYTNPVTRGLRQQLCTTCTLRPRMFVTQVLGTVQAFRCYAYVAFVTHLYLPNPVGEWKRLFGAMVRHGWWRVVAYAPRGSTGAGPERGAGGGQRRGRIPAVTSRPPSALDIHLASPAPTPNRSRALGSTVSAIIVATIIYLLRMSKQACLD